MNNSLEEVHQSVSTQNKKTGFRKILAFFGPAYLISVGYMDPGNWATDLSGGAQFGYTLLFVIFISSLFAILLQHLALKLGVATGRDLAQACGDYFSKPIAFFLWILCELAITACDLAEVIGSALALNLLFDIPILMGILIFCFLYVTLQSNGNKRLAPRGSGMSFSGHINVQATRYLEISGPATSSPISQFLNA